MEKIQIIKYKKMIFYKNKSQEGGALKQALEDNKENKNIIHIHNKHQGRAWGLVDNEKLLKLIEKNIGLYEVVAYYPFKVYLDIDGDKLTNLEEIKQIINKYFKDPDMAISGYETEDKKSYHIILNNYIINNDEEREKLKHIIKFFYGLNSCFDWKVYTKNRNMKAINQSKINKPEQKIIYNNDYKKHLITAYFNKNPYNINSILCEEVEKEEVKKYNYIDYAKYKNILEMKTPEDIDINNPRDLLNITPLCVDYDHAYTWRVARFCYFNGLKLEDFLKWYSKKSTEEKNINKWRSHWNLIENHPEISKSQYLKFLSNFYPELIKKADPFYELFNIKEEEQKKIININRLEKDHIQNGGDCQILNLGMGEGKTTQTINYLKTLNNDQNFIWITPNISLAENTYTRIKEAGLFCNIYNKATNKKEKEDLIKTSKNIIICLNSLFYTDKKYKVVVIDEIETFLKLFHNNATLKELNEVFKKFIEILKAADKVLLLDAFISRITLYFLEEVGIKYEIIKKETINTKRQAVIKKNFKSWLSDIIKDLKENKKLLIFYPFKHSRTKQNLPSMKGLKDFITQETEKKGIYHNADAGDKINKKLKDVNKEWIKYDFIISNNKINVGLNFDLSHFDTVYISIAGFNSARDLIQFTYRARTLKTNTLKYCFIDHFNNTQGAPVQSTEYYNNIFKSLNNNIIKETEADLKGSFKFFLNMAGYEILNETIYEELEPLEIIEEDFYNYDNIEDYHIIAIKDIEKEIYKQKASTLDKLTVKKYYFNKQFKEGTDPEVLRNLWNNNKFNLIINIKNILINDNIIYKLKNKYKWSLFYPDNIDKKFNFTAEELKEIFNNYKFKSLTENSKHHLILKSLLNTVYGCQVVKTKKDKSKHTKIYIDEDFKNYYEQITKNLKQQAPEKEPDFLDN